MSHLAYIRDIKSQSNSKAKDDSNIDPLLSAMGGALFGSLFTYLYLNRQIPYSSAPVIQPILGARVLAAEGATKSAYTQPFKSIMHKPHKQQGPPDYKSYFNQIASVKYAAKLNIDAGGYYYCDPS